MFFSLTLSIFSKESAFRGSQPLRASPQTSDSHVGHPAATCSPSKFFGGLLRLGSGFDLFLSLLGLLSFVSVTTTPFGSFCSTIASSSFLISSSPLEAAAATATLAAISVVSVLVTETLFTSLRLDSILVLLTSCCLDPETDPGDPGRPNTQPISSN